VRGKVRLLSLSADESDDLEGTTVSAGNTAGADWVNRDVYRFEQRVRQTINQSRRASTNLERSPKFPE
jgi:hypothetical protein